MVEECSTCGQVTERHGTAPEPRCPECGHTIVPKSETPYEADRRRQSGISYGQPAAPKPAPGGGFRLTREGKKLLQEIIDDEREENPVGVAEIEKILRRASLERDKEDEMTDCQHLELKKTTSTTDDGGATLLLQGEVRSRLARCQANGNHGELWEARSGIAREGRREMSEQSWEQFKRDVFPKALAVAQHQDQKNSWPWIGRFLHRLIAWRCPCCKLERELSEK